MSLFRAREWWSAKLGEQEEFDKGSMALGNVDNDPDDTQIKIVTGSFQGMLRVHYPKQPYFRIEDLLLEQDLGAPILQVIFGRFIPTAPRIKSIAVLHPRKLGVYIVEAVGEQRVKASYFNLVKVYEHALGGIDGGHFTAYNMTHGGFGGISRDLLCVQSMDGRLQVFEQDAHAFTRRLHGILTPGPICYVARIDAFIVGNSEMGVDCYKYQALAASQSDHDDGKGEGISAARGLQAYWSCRLGEPAMDIFVAKFSRCLGPGCVDIVVLGERTLFTLREQGTVRLQKILGYQPACGCKYAVTAAPGEEGARVMGTTVDEASMAFSTVVEEENVIIAADTDHLLVYKDMQLVWQAAVGRAPVAVAIDEFGGLPGLVCSLDDGGVLSVCYQGTDPPTSAVVALDTKEIDYDHINQEHRKLLQVIRRSQIDSARPPAGKLTLQVQVPRFLDNPVMEEEQNVRNPGVPSGPASDDTDTHDPEITACESGCLKSTPAYDSSSSTGGVASVTARFVISYSGAGELRGATLNISPPSGFSAYPSSTVLPPVKGTGSADLDERGKCLLAKPCVVSVVFRVERGTGQIPSTMLGHASVVYTRPSSSFVSGASGSGGVDSTADLAPRNANEWGTEPMSARSAIRLPLAMAVGVVEDNDADIAGTAGRGGEGAPSHEIVFNTNEAPLLLSDLFADIFSAKTHQRQRTGEKLDAELDRDWISNGAGGRETASIHSDKDTTASSLSFRYWGDAITIPEGQNQQDVRVTVSKTSGKYQLQSESFAALSVIATELVRRLGEYFGDEDSGERRRSEMGSSAAGEGEIAHDKDARLRIEYTPGLPLAEFYSCIDDHFERRIDLLRAKEKLNAAAHQYRVIEKRLLVRFKDRNPSPLDRLDVVSEETYLRLVDLGDEVHRAQERLVEGAGNLACAVRLLGLLMRCRFQLGRKDHALLVAHLHPEVVDTDEQGWEEIVDAALTHLLRTALAKVAKDSVPIPASGHPPLVMPQDTSKLKKHISILCDRLSKGARLALRPAAPPSSPPQQVSPSNSPPSSPFSQWQRSQQHRIDRT